MLNLTLIKIDERFNYHPYLHWFDLDTQQTILRYHFKIDQLRAFTSALLKYYYLPHLLKRNPNAITLDLNVHKRPYLKSHPDYDFSLSHSGDYVIFALSDQTIGIDIEKIDPKIEVSAIGDIVFSTPEQLRVGDSIDNFYTLWSKKEAYLKALGGGFFEQYKVTDIDLESVEIKPNYQIYTLKCDPLYSAAFCVLTKSSSQEV